VAVSGVVAAVRRDLAVLDRRRAGLSRSSLAATALALAASLDDPDVSATAKANCSRELRDTFAALRALAPVERSADALDELKRRRQRRRKAS
jgi:hypothetical protein